MMRSILILTLVFLGNCNTQKPATYTSLEFSKSNLPTHLNYSGNIVKGLKWKDAEGIHYVLITEGENGKICEKGYKSELHAYRYSLKADSANMDWEIKDFGENECSSIHYLESSLILSDVDTNGVAETSFFYELSHDCCDPLVVKYMLHVSGAKLPIRGKIPMIEEDFPKYTKLIDTIYNNYPPVFYKYASTRWDEFIKKHYDINQ
jgi:hypothetical protein